MSFRSLQENGITSKVLVDNVENTGAQWSRNASWLTLPSVSFADEKFVGLYQINKSANFIALNFTTSSGDYFINWGDGNIEQVASGTTAQHEYDYNNVALANTDAPVTFTDSTDLVNRVSHGYTNGMTISFASITTTTGISPTQVYYVINATPDTFQLSSTPNGSAIPLTNNGTGTILPYKQAIVTVVPFVSSQTITALNLYIKSSLYAGIQSGYATGWTDIAIASSATSIGLGQANMTDVTFNLLEQVNILRCSLTSYSYLFSRLTALKKVVGIFSTAAVTDISFMFSNSVSIQEVPLFDTSNVTNMSGTFSNASSLQSVPLYNTANVTNMSTMFTSCRALQSVPLFNTVNVTNMSSMFNSCVFLETVPLFNTANVTNMSSMFTGAAGTAGGSRLRTVPLFNTANVTNMSSMFSHCRSLESVPLFNTASVTDMSLMFNICRALKEVPLFNTVSVTTMSTMFSSCQALVTVPKFNTPALTNTNNMFNGCTALTSAPHINTSMVTNMSSMFTGCVSLTEVPLYDTSLATNMSGMFSSCTSLTQVPLFNTASATDINSMFNNCSSLKSIPQLNTSSVISMANLFSGCISLSEIPALSVTSIPDSNALGNMFNNAFSVCKVNMTGIKYSVSFLGLKLSGAELNNIYTNLAPVGGNVTFTMAGNIVTKVAHGYLNGQTIRFSSVTNNVNVLTTYYIINKTPDTFQISSTLSGTPFTFSVDGTGVITSEIITVINNYGTATDNPSIATAKGWTVSG